MATKPDVRKFRKGTIPIFFTVFLGSLLGGSGIAYATDEEPTAPENFGEQFGNNDFSGGGAKTLYESYDSGDYVMPTDTSWGDVLASAVNGAADFLFFITKGIVSAVITLVSWLFDMNGTGEVTDGLSSMIGGTTTAFMTWLLPTALAAGALVAYIHAKRDGNGGAIGQLTWIAVAALFTVSLSTTPQVWTTTVDDVRTLAVDGVNTATADALTVNEDFPFSFEGPDYGGQDTSEEMKRKTSDALWRNFVAMPWCLSTLGSIEACERYGQDILDKHGDKDAIVKYIKQDMADSEGGEESATVKYAKGHQYWERLGQTAMVSVVALVMAAAIMVLGFGAFSCMVLSWLLLAIGGFFAMLWVLPGPTRDWGKQWFFALVGAVAGAAVKMLIFQASVLVVIAVLGTDWALGIRTLTAIVVVIAGLGLNRILDSIVGSNGSGMLRTMATGYMAGRAMKSVAKGAGRLAGGAGKLALAGGRGAARGAEALNSLRNRNGQKTNQPNNLADMGERTASHRQFRALEPSPASRLPELGMNRGSMNKPAPRSLPSSEKGGINRNGVAFQGERGRIPMPANNDRQEPQSVGRRPMRINPSTALSANIGRHGSSNAARPSGLPEGPRRPARTSRTAGNRPQFRSVPQPTVIKGEVISTGPGTSPRRPRRTESGQAPRARQVPVQTANGTKESANRSRRAQAAPANNSASRRARRPKGDS